MARKKKLPTGITQLPSGKYRARVHVGGGRQRGATFTNLRDAVRWREDAIRAKETGRVGSLDADLQPFHELAAEHFRAEAPEWSERTLSGYRTLWTAHVRPYEIRDLPLRSITPETIENWRDDLRAAGVGEASIRKTMTLVQSILERGVRLGRMGGRENPAKAVKKPKAKRAATVNALSPDQVEAIRANLRGADAAMVSVLAYTGMRPGEARALRWGDLGKQTIRVERATDPDGTGKLTKTEKPRSVRLLGPVRDDLTAWRKASGNPADSALIFPRDDGKAWTDDDWRNWRNRKFKTAAKAAGVEITRAYDLRHSAASLWLHEGVNPVQVAAWLGHSPSMLLTTYAHVVADLDPDDRTSAADMIRRARRDRDTPVTWLSDRRSQAAV